MPEKITSTSGMSIGEGLAWWVMIICTCGLAWPLYRARRHKLNRTTTTVIGG